MSKACVNDSPGGDGAGLQRFAIEPGRRVRDGVLIRPGDAAADRNGDLGWVEREILDLDGKGFRGGVGTSVRRARRGLLGRFGAGATGAGGLDEVDGYPGLVAFGAEPGDTGVPGIVELAQAR